MPKETITPTHNTRAEDDRPGNWEPYPAIEVSWMRDLSHVGIGITTPDTQHGQHHLVDVLYGDRDSLISIGSTLIDWARSAGATIGEPVEAEDGVPGGWEVSEDVCAEVGRLALDAVTGSGMGYYGYFTSLTERRDLNHLIRQLKRARDGAFGRDE